MNDKKDFPINMSKGEEPMFFSSNLQDQACIGHLRGDFGRGTEFWTTWWDHHEELKNQEFKAELDNLVNTLRKDGPLKDLSSMQAFCRENAQAQMSPRSGSEYYGFRVDTTQHRYYLRFCPMRGNYNFYIYCYKAAHLEKTIKVLVVEPMRPCRVEEIPDTLKTMQKIVGGYIEAVYPFPDPVAIIVNEEGKLMGLPLNRPLVNEGNPPYDILFGTFIITGVSGEEFVSLTEDQVQRYKSLYDHLMIFTT